MCAWDKNYHNLAYPKVMIASQEMTPREKSFYDNLVEVLKDEIEIDDLVVEQRDSNYRTVVYGSWDNDFLRYHFGADGFWVSVRMPRNLMKEYQDSPLFAAQENKRQFHWRSSVKPDEVSQIGNVIAKSAVHFLNALNCGGNRKSSSRAESSELPRKLMGDTKALPKTAARDLEAAWALSGGDKQQLKKVIAQVGCKPCYAREISLTGTNYYKAASKLKGGEILTCKSEEDNPYDSTAVALFDKSGSQVGYLPKNGIKLEVFEALQSGHEIIAVVTHCDKRAGLKRDRTHIMLISAI